MTPDPKKIRSFASAAAFETWLAAHHDFRYLTDEASAIDAQARVLPLLTGALAA